MNRNDSTCHRHVLSASMLVEGWARDFLSPAGIQLGTSDAHLFKPSQHSVDMHWRVFYGPAFSRAMIKREASSSWMRCTSKRFCMDGIYISFSVRFLLHLPSRAADARSTSLRCCSSVFSQGVGAAHWFQQGPPPFLAGLSVEPHVVFLLGRTGSVWWS